MRIKLFRRVMKATVATVETAKARSQARKRRSASAAGSDDVDDDNDDDDDDEPWGKEDALGVSEVDFGDLTLFWDKRLGSGWHGPVVKGGNGTASALPSSISTSTTGSCFQQEIEAYTGMLDLQRAALARLLFVSRSWSRAGRLVGLEVGTQVRSDETNFRSELRRVKRQLKEAG